MSGNARRAAQRLESALIAVGGPLRDESQRPREPCVSPLGRPLLSKEEAVALSEDDKHNGGLEEAILLGSAAVDAPRLDNLVPVQDLLSRRRGIEARLESMQTEGLRARSLLREVEALVQRAIDDDLNEDFQPSSAPPSARSGVALGGRLAPSQPASARMAGRGAYGASSSAVAGGVAANAPVGGGWGGADGSAGGASNAEIVRARRLEQCAEMESQIEPMRASIDAHHASLGAAAHDNARLAARAATALSALLAAVWEPHMGALWL